MESLSFSSRPQCADCTEHSLVEYAPEERIEVSKTTGSDNWNYSLIIDGTGYVSNGGVRWITGNIGSLMTLRLLDPRSLVTWTLDENLEGDTEFDGQPVTVVGADLDVEAFLDSLEVVSLDSETRQVIRGGFAGIALRFWLDREARVLQMEISSADGESLIQRFDYVTPVDISGSIESMPYQEAQRLGQQAEAGGETLIEALDRFEQANGEYPEMLDEQTLAGALNVPWPENPFSGQPMRSASDSPGDFSYIAKNDGADFELKVHGWDDEQLFYDTEGFGP
jgi:hypothetical protein